MLIYRILSGIKTYVNYNVTEKGKYYFVNDFKTPVKPGKDLFMQEISSILVRPLAARPATTMLMAVR
jgi:hypothetical protein